MFKKAMSKLKIYFCTFSPPNFVTSVSRDNEGILDIFLSRR